MPALSETQRNDRYLQLLPLIGRTLGRLSARGCTVESTLEEIGLTCTISDEGKVQDVLRRIAEEGLNPPDALEELVEWVEKIPTK